MTIRANISPDSTSRSEQAFARIAGLLDDDWLVWMNRKWKFPPEICDSTLREVDAILYHRVHGVLLVECKSGKIYTKTSQKGEVIWMQNKDSLPKSPRDQVSSLISPLHDLLKFLLQAPEGKGPYKVRVQWAVCFSDKDTMAGIPQMEISRRQTILRSDMLDVKKFEKKLIEALETPDSTNKGYPFINEYLDEKAFCTLRDFFDGNGGIPSETDLLLDDGYYSDQATEMQQMLMESISRNKRIRVEGVAGSGKSRIVVWEALRLSKLGKRVAIACYNDLLANDLRTDIKAILKKEHENKDNGGIEYGPIEVNAYSEWCEKYTKAADNRPEMGSDKSLYYDIELPKAFEKAQSKLSKDKKQREKFFFDAILIDEAQDFSSVWIDTLISLLQDKERGLVRVFYDPAQRLYDSGRNGIDNEHVQAMPIMVLNRGFRNTKKILKWIEDNTNIHLQCYNNTPPGKPVKKVTYSDKSEQEKLLISCYEELMSKYKFSPEDILVVSMRSEASSGIKGIKDDRFIWNKVGGKKLTKDKVNIVSVRRIKGLDALAVILVDVEEPEEISKRENWKRLLLVGASRAKKLLTVIRKKPN